MECSPITDPTYSYTVDPQSLVAIFDADMPRHQEYQSVNDANGASVIRSRTMSCHTARAIVLAVNNTLIPADVFLYPDASDNRSRPDSATTPYGQFQCQSKTSSSVRCVRGRTRIAWTMLGT